MDARWAWKFRWMGKPSRFSQSCTGLGSKMAISGGRPEKNNDLWDGISLNDNGNNSPGSVLGITPGVEAVDRRDGCGRGEGYRPGRHISGQ